MNINNCNTNKTTNLNNIFNQTSSGLRSNNSNSSTVMPNNNSDNSNFTNSNSGNINNAYFSMAKQLKLNKQFNNTNKNLQKSSNNDVNSISGVNKFIYKPEIDNIKKSKSISNTEVAIIKCNNNINLLQNKNDKSVYSFKNSMQIFSSNTDNNINGPEEMHFFNLSLAKYNKKLAFKFENLDSELEIDFI